MVEGTKSFIMFHEHLIFSPRIMILKMNYGLD